MNEHRAYSPRQVWDDDHMRALDVGEQFDRDKQAMIEQAEKSNQTVFRSIENLKLVSEDWYRIAVETFGPGMVALYMANGVKEDGD